VWCARTSRPCTPRRRRASPALRLPGFVREEFGAYLDCGQLHRGFALMACPGCPERHLVAFSCKRRGFCPSCLGRRMAQTTANLLDHVLPQTPLRQWVFTVPHVLRTRLAYDRVLLARVGRLFVATVLGFYRRRLGDLRVHQGRGQSGAVTVVQRTSADLKLMKCAHYLA
jgi:Transposase zinc-binding domain